MNKCMVKKAFCTAWAAALLAGSALGGEKPAAVQIASFRTPVAHQSPEVKHNIALACSSLNGVRIPAGGVFSFSDVVGEASSKNGYLEGAVLYQDSVVLEAGGGLCQVSSTLFNALLLSGCSIVERHRHYQPVAYTPLGLDATIKYGKKNLRMKNVTGQELLILAKADEASCMMIIMGSFKPEFTYSLETEENEISLPLSEEGAVRPGLEIYVYRNKLKEHRVTESFLLYKDFYPPVKIK